jgi:hypothetical protein
MQLGAHSARFLRIFWLVLAPEKQKDALVSGVDGAISAHFEQKFTRILMSSVVTLNHRSQESVT